MTPDGSDATLIGPAAADPPWRLRLGTAGSFRLEGPESVEARYETTGWSIQANGFDPGTRLIPKIAGGELVLTDSAGTDMGSVATLAGGTIAEDPPSVTLSDGRVFRIACARTGYAIRGWESPGAYVRVAPDEAGWRFCVTVAGTGMAGMDRLILLAAAAIARDAMRMEGMTP